VINDNALRKAIEEALGEPVTQAGLAALTELHADKRGIYSLAGLDQAIHLAHLSLVDNEIENITPLARLTELETLYLDRNACFDLSPLAGLVNLRRLSLGGFWVDEDVGTLTLEAFGPAWGPAITNVAPLARLTNLTELHIQNHAIRDIKPLARLRRLTQLTLNGYRGGGPIRDFSPLCNLAQLERLVLCSNKISDISALKCLERLAWLDLRINEIRDIEPLLALPKLRHLNPCKNPLSEHARKEQIPQLRKQGVRVLW
jgi:Leucine-rich repeat (LRR) protein